MIIIIKINTFTLLFLYALRLKFNPIGFANKKYSEWLLITSAIKVQLILNLVKHQSQSACLSVEDIFLFQSLLAFNSQGNKLCISTHTICI